MGLPPLTLGARPREGAGQSDTSRHIQRHGVLRELLCSSTACAGEDSDVHQDGVSHAVGKAGPGRARGAQAQRSGLHTASWAGGGLRGHVHHEGQTDGQGRAPRGPSVHGARPKRGGTVAWTAGHHVHTQAGRGSAGLWEERGSGAGGRRMEPRGVPQPRPGPGPSPPRPMFPQPPSHP